MNSYVIEIQYSYQNLDENNNNDDDDSLVKTFSLFRIEEEGMFFDVHILCKIMC